MRLWRKEKKLNNLRWAYRLNECNEKYRRRKQCSQICRHKIIKHARTNSQPLSILSTICQWISRHHLSKQSSSGGGREEEGSGIFSPFTWRHIFCCQAGTVPPGISAWRPLGKNLWYCKQTRRKQNRKIPDSSQVIFNLGSEKALHLYEWVTKPFIKYHGEVSE